MGRPHIKDQAKRVVQVNIRLTADEYNKVSSYATASGLSPANWIRKKIFTGKFPAMKESPIDTETYQELKKIGVNINQATHKLNQGEMPKDYLLFVLQLRSILERTLKHSWMTGNQVKGRSFRGALRYNLEKVEKDKVGSPGSFVCKGFREDHHEGSPDGTDATTRPQEVLLSYFHQFFRPVKIFPTKE